MLDPQIIRELKGLLGRGRVKTDMESLIAYSYDGTFQERLPDVVVKAFDVSEVSKIMKIAGAYGVPVVPRGAGTGLSGGVVPLKGGIVLEMTAFNRIIEINTRNKYAVVEPGVCTNDFAEAVEKAGLFYPPDPASSKSSTLGGNVAECAGGPRGVKYGVTKDYVMGLELVLPDGEILNVGNQVDGETGWFDLPLLFTGSEGTLGIITKIIFRLMDKPEQKQTLLAKYDQVVDAGKTVSSIIKNGVIPTTMEIMDRTTIQAVENFLKIGLDTKKDAFLLLEVDGSKYEVTKQLEQVKQICLECGAVEVETASTKEESDRLWKARRSISGACGKINPTKIGEDATVPRSKIPEMIVRLREIADKYQLKMVIFGHAGDGNLHPNILTDKRNSEAMERVEQAVGELLNAALSLGGTLSGEHGIGYMKAPFLKMELGEIGYQTLKKVKEVFDPKGVLNPGKIFLSDS
jgi:glycolate oxidase